MKGFKTRTVRPGSARPKTSQVPGVTETAHPDLNALFIESKLKDIELEKSRSKLLLHIEAKRSIDEKSILNKKYEETLNSLNEAHHNRMKALTNQHHLATETLIDQFNQEVLMLKSTQKAGLDRLILEHRSEIERYEEIIANLKAENNRKAEKNSREHEKKLRELQEKMKKQLESEKSLLRESFEKEKQDLLNDASKERDSQVKMIINKVYEESRKEWKNQEFKLLDEIRSLKFQLESLKIKVKSQEDLVRHSKEEFFQSQVFDSNQKFHDWSLENVQNFSIFADKERKDKQNQTIFTQIKEVSCQTDDLNNLQSTPPSSNSDLSESLLIPKVQSCLNSKNLQISGYQSLITSLLIQNKDLSTLLKSLNT